MQCSICLDDADSPTTLSCGHGFHPTCLFKWGQTFYTKASSCPMCRAPVKKFVDGNAAVTRFHMSGMLLGDIVLMKESAALGSHLCAFTLGNIYYSGMGTDENLVLAEEYWKQADIYSMSWNNLATMECKRGNAVKAAEYYRKAITLNPGEMKYYMNLARILGCSVETSEVYLTVVALVTQPVSQAGIYYLLGHNEYKLKKNAVALSYYEKCLEITPSNVHARLMAAMLCPNAKRGHTYVDMVISANRENVEALCIKGHMHVNDGDISAAFNMCSRAYALAPGSAAAHRLNVALRKFGPMTRKRARLN